MNQFLFKPIWIIVFTLLILPFVSCENHHFDSDKRQIIAKDAIRDQLHKVQDFNVIHFNEDTVETADSNFKKQIRYSMDIVFLDSNKVFHQQKAIVWFTTGGPVIGSQIVSD
jgi:hypothetical protein